MKFPNIDTFDHYEPAVISAMRDMGVGVFEHIEIASNMDVDKSIKYTERILILVALKKYRQFLAGARSWQRG